MGKLRPSTANVWLACPKAPTLMAQVPELEDAFTIRGEQLHIRAAYDLREALGIPQIPMTIIVESQDARDTAAYVSFCLTLMKDTFDSAENLHLMVEEKIPLGDFLIDGNGIIDFAAYNEDMILICDYKTGFVRIDARENAQLNCYALALVFKLQKAGYSPKKVRVAIGQPSQDNLSIFTQSVEDLMAWLDKNKQKISDAYNNFGEYCPGEHCNHCNAKAMCRAYLLKTLGGLGNEQQQD